MWHFGVGMGRARLSRAAAVIAATTAATAADSSSDGISASISSSSSGNKQIAIQSLESLRTFCTTFHSEEQQGAEAGGGGGSNYYASYGHPVAALCTIASAILADAVRDARIKAF